MIVPCFTERFATMTDRPLDAPERDDRCDRVGQLRTAELFALAAARLWVADFLQQGEGTSLGGPCWRSGFVAADLDDATVIAFDQFFQAFAAGATRQIEFRCPACARLSPDERRYLEALSLLQRDRRAAAEAILAGWLAPAARRVALTAAHAVAAAMADAGLTLPWRIAETALPHSHILYADQGHRLVH